MTPKEARNAVYSTFLTQWAGATPVLLENQDDEPPGADEAWVRLTFQHNDGDYAALGGDQTQVQFFRRFGVLIGQVFVPKGGGTSDLDELCYTALKIFDDSIQGIFFTSPRVLAVPIRADEKWMQRNIIVEFQYDDNH